MAEGRMVYAIAPAIFLSIAAIYVAPMAMKIYDVVTNEIKTPSNPPLAANPFPTSARCASSGRKIFIPPAKEKCPARPAPLHRQPVSHVRRQP
jgi:hypothetical protein